MSTIKRSKTDAFSVKESVNIVKLAEAAFEQVSLDQLTDVVVETPTDGDILVYSSDLMAWENVPQAGLNYGLEDLDNITITSVSDGQVLTWDSGTSKWVNETPTTGATNLDGLSDVTISTPSNGQVLKYNGSAWVNGADSGATPGGSDTHVQYNDSGVLGGKSSFTFNETTDTLSVPKVSASDGLYTLSASTLGFGSARIYDSGDEMGFIADATDNLGLDTRAFRFNTASAAPEFYDGSTYRTVYHSGNLTAANTPYDNATSGLTATDVQGAIDEVVSSSDPFDQITKTFLWKHADDSVVIGPKYRELKQQGYFNLSECCQTGQFKVSGKWYFEYDVISTSTASGSYALFGVAQAGHARNTKLATVNNPGRRGWAVRTDGQKLNDSNTGTAYGAAIVTSDIVMVAVDIDSSKIWFGSNGTWFASGDPASGANAAFTNVDTLTVGVSPALTCVYNDNIALRISAGEFDYTPPTGFSAWDS